MRTDATVPCVCVVSWVTRQRQRRDWPSASIARFQSVEPPPPPPPARWTDVLLTTLWMGHPSQQWDSPTLRRMFVQLPVGRSVEKMPRTRSEG
jgi:hypothetical protein